MEAGRFGVGRCELGFFCEFLCFPEARSVGGVVEFE